MSSGPQSWGPLYPRAQCYSWIRRAREEKPHFIQEGRSLKLVLTEQIIDPS